MITVLPSILSNSIDNVRSKIEIVKGLVEMIHIDFMDETFVPNKTIEIKELIGIYFPMEIHMMVSNPLKYFDDLKHISPTRIIVHQEIDQLENVINELKEITPFIVIAQKLDTYLSLNYKHVLLMSEPNLGYSGQGFSFEVLPKIKQLKAESPHTEIGVDGGIDDITAKACRVAGAERVSVNSYLFREDEPLTDFDKDLIAEKIQKLANV